MTIDALFPVSRRAAMGGMAALPFIGSGSALAADDAVTLGSGGLNQAAQRTGRRWGSCIGFNALGGGGSIQNGRYTAVVKAECGVVVPENELKWQWTRPGPDSFDFSRMDAVAAWARANDVALRGHTLLWHRPQWFPTWLNNYDFGARPVHEAERLLTTHIRTVTDRYRGQITSYDVVNEAIDHDTNGTLATSMSRAMGSPEAVIDLAFHTARQQLPDAQLVYNDYMSWEPDHANHCAAVLRLLEGFRRRNVPVDALGVQSHIELYALDHTSGSGRYREAEWRRFLDEVVAMGYKLLITEFDVKDKALPGPLRLRDERVADYTRRYFDVMLDYPQLSDVLAWGMVDRFNWLQGFAPRDDGLEVRGTPYSSYYQAKLMREAIAGAFTAA